MKQNWRYMIPKQKKKNGPHNLYIYGKLLLSFSVQQIIPFVHTEEERLLCILITKYFSNNLTCLMKKRLHIACKLHVIQPKKSFYIPAIKTLFLLLNQTAFEK